jgi:S1-C subfamily serine protease
MTKDCAEAVKWFRKAAEQGNAFGQMSLAFCYEEGNGVAKDYNEAAVWCRKAAEQGNPLAQYNLGVCYSEGQGLEKDFAQAVKWYLRAAEQGNAHAQFSLALCYEDGIGVAKDDIEAYKWFNLAAAQGGAGGSRWRDLLAAEMTKEQIAEAQRRSSQFVPRPETPPPARSAHPSATPSDQSAAQSGGTGFFVTEDGYLATSFHLVEGATRIVIRTEKGTLSARLINADRVNDVAILKAEGKFPAVPVAPSRATKVGETVFTIGFPNPGLQDFAPKVTKGEISSLTGAQQDPREFQLSAAVQAPNSGGPLLNQYGNVVGVVGARPADTATLKSAGSLPQNVNYAVKSSVLNVLLESLPELSSKLKEPHPPNDRKFEDVVKEAQSATALVLVY